MKQAEERERAGPAAAGAETQMSSVHSMWFPPPNGGRGEQADPLCRELFERLAEIQLDHDAHHK
jgi:hypothetical protein